jgi:alkyl hydroperoxide reductase subunit AhpF
MALLSEVDQDRLREAFAALTRPVRLLFFTQSVGCETCLEARQILDELPPLSDKVTVEEVNFVLENDRAGQYGVDRVPSIAVTFDDPPKDSRIRFLGAPSGYEFMSLVQAVLVAGGAVSILSPENRARVAAAPGPVTMQVFTTPG